MGEKMSLAQVRDQIAAVATEDDYMLQGWIAAIDAHLAQPAQAVDVGAIREVIERTRKYYEVTDNCRNDPTMESELSDIHEVLTRALSGEKAGPVDGCYIQDSRSFVGNDMLFWCADRNGYTTDLRKAGVYTLEQALKQQSSRSSDVPWPKAYIDAKARPAVDFQHVSRKDIAPASPTPDKEGV